jgi:hypothetical protein
MGRLSGVYEDAATGQWRVDKLFRRQRLQGRYGSYKEAQSWLLARWPHPGYPPRRSARECETICPTTTHTGDTA